MPIVIKAFTPRGSDNKHKCSPKNTIGGFYRRVSNKGI
jgi:hypothetical protein